MHRPVLEKFNPDAAVDCRALTRADAEAALAVLPEGIRLVVISSIDVYRAFGALNDDRETDPVPIDEDSPVRAHRYPYRGTRAGMDDYDKLDVEDLYYQRREEFILRRVRAGRKQIPVGAGMWLACRGYVRDVARGARLALESPVAGGEVYNLCEDRTFSMGLWSRMILEASGSDAELVRVSEDRLPEDLKPTGTMSQHILASSRKARNALGWTTTDPQATLQATVAWHLANAPDDPDQDFSADDSALARE
jgi:nucleoside-diphosphate-sugar epimerase